jgi:hypothetical protein
MMTSSMQRDFEKYCQAHPLGAAALKHPRVVLDRGRYVAFLGRSMNRGVLGFGTSMASALHAFDEIYPSYLRSRRAAKEP